MEREERRREERRNPKVSLLVVDRVPRACDLDCFDYHAKDGEIFGNAKGSFYVLPFFIKAFLIQMPSARTMRKISVEI